MEVASVGGLSSDCGCSHNLSSNPCLAHRKSSVGPSRFGRPQIYKPPRRSGDGVAANLKARLEVAGPCMAWPETHWIRQTWLSQNVERRTLPPSRPNMRLTCFHSLFEGKRFSDRTLIRARGILQASRSFAGKFCTYDRHYMRHEAGSWAG